MSSKGREEREAVLDPISRVSEIIFGLLMALSFTGAINAATDGREEVRTMLLAALGCNIAWGLVDAVMYLVTLRTERERNLAMIRRIRGTEDPAAARGEIAAALPGRLAEALGPEELDGIRRWLVAQPEPPRRAGLAPRDLVAAFSVFLLVALATFPVVVPFLLIDTTHLAMRVSNGVALAMLFVAGFRLSRYAGGTGWASGLGMMAVGAALVSIIVALGG